MKETTIKIFHFSELTPEAQETAITNYMSNTDASAYHWHDEWLDSLKALADHFGCRVADYQISTGRYSYAKLDTSRIEGDCLELRGVRAWTWLLVNGLGINPEGHMPTGYCGDYEAFQPLAAFMLRPTDTSIAELIQDCANSLVAGWVADMEHTESREYALQELTEGYLCEEEAYTADGELYLLGSEL